MPDLEPMRVLGWFIIAGLILCLWWSKTDAE
jgi:hypothetical protein